MPMEWSELVRLTGGASFTVERVKLADNDISIEGSFTLPPLAELQADDQIFVAAFVGVHGSIKDMERLFGISYPTVKARLDRLAERLKMVEVSRTAVSDEREDVLSRLEKGEISAEEALRRLGK
ncbi:MAG: DUF2089 domain-containing protein [Dehalococcoidia bacterium]|nr:DUF2089 domain-containing protein [Dehalococcoidia bacterium]